jgi:C4-dicarboxylate transporter DctM subunit
MPLGLFAAALLLLLFIGTPTGLSLVSTAILPKLVQPSFPYTVEMAVRSLAGGMDSFLLLAIPLFMFSGVIMARGGISEKLFNVFAYFFGNVIGGYPIAVVLTCMFYGAISGSGPATTAAVGAMSIPFLVKRGYEPVFAAALVATAGGLGVIIPPSIPMIAYSAISSVSVGQLFIAGIIPGILIGACLIVYARIYCKRHGEDRVALQAYYQEIRGRGFWAVAKDSFPALMAPVVILGGIYGGITTPTEAASISVYYALIVSIFYYKTLKWRDLPAILRETVKSYAPLIFVIGCAMVLSRVIALMQISRMIEQFVFTHISSGIGVLLMINLILLIAGMFIEAIPALMIFTPVILPLAVGAGMTPLHLGIVMVVNLAIGFVTPPIGINLFVASNMTGIPALRIARSGAPFVLAFLFALLLITFIPAISLCLL